MACFCILDSDTKEETIIQEKCLHDFARIHQMCQSKVPEDADKRVDLSTRLKQPLLQKPPAMSRDL